MNVSEQARQAYAPTQFPVRTPRSMEAQLVTQVTARLRRAAASKNDFAALVAALHDNRVMWTTLATGVADVDNGLPQQLRAQLFYLAEFTEHHSKLVLKGDADAGVLIEINTAVLRGLNDMVPV